MIVAAAALAVASIAPATAYGSQVPDLAGLTSIEGHDSSWTPVRLRSPVRIDLGADTRPRARMGGKGRVRAAILRRDGNATNEPGLVGISFGEEEEVAILSATPISDSARRDGHVFVDLPAGVYRVYLVGDGPLRLDLSLPALSGAASLRTVVPVTPTVRELVRRDGNGAVSNVASLGAGFELGTPGFLLAELLFESDVIAYDELQGCVYEPGESFAHDDAFARGCPGASGAEDPPASLRVPPSGGRSGLLLFDASARAGDWGLGGNLLMAGTPPALSGFGVSLDYGPAGLPPGFTLDPSKPARSKRVKQCRRSARARRGDAARTSPRCRRPPPRQRR